MLSRDIQQRDQNSLVVLGRPDRVQLSAKFLCTGTRATGYLVRVRHELSGAKFHAGRSGHVQLLCLAPGVPLGAVALQWYTRKVGLDNLRLGPLSKRPGHPLANLDPRH